MHELSIAVSIVEAVTESAAYPGARVKAVALRVGALASVVEDSLQFCWDLARMLPAPLVFLGKGRQQC